MKKNKEFKIDKLKKLWVKLKIPDSVQEEFLESIGDDLNPLVFEKVSDIKLYKISLTYSV